MWSKVAATAKVLFIAILFAFYVFCFGLSQVRKYLKKGILIEVSENTALETIEAPKITIFALNRETGLGWKMGNARILCRGNSSCYSLCGADENITECILNSTYKSEDFILYPPQNMKKLKWSESNEITVSNKGNCFSYESREDKLSMNILVHMKLKKGLVYNIYLHDKNFFWVSEDPIGNPGMKLDMSNPGKNIQETLVKYQIIQNEKLNMERQPCETKDNYNFADCLRFMTEYWVNCRLPWHTHIPRNPPMQTCTERGDFIMHDLHYKSRMASELKEIVDKTECLIPCKFQEIKQIGDPLNFVGSEKSPDPDSFTLGLRIISTNIKTETETLVYPFLSLIAEIGGTLGLFLGFSFLMVWDWVDTALHLSGQSANRI